MLVFGLVIVGLCRPSRSTRAAGPWSDPRSGHAKSDIADIPADINTSHFKNAKVGGAKCHNWHSRRWGACAPADSLLANYQHFIACH
jgi:hypothetical protein